MPIERKLHRGMLVAAILGFVMVMSAVANSSGPDYLLGAGDLVKVSVFGSPDLDTEARVSQSGAITCPLLGSVSVAGLSTSQVETLLARRFIDGKYLRQPQVSVLVMEFQSQKVSVLGYVGRPGQYPLRASVSVMDVLAEAGGLLPDTAGDRASLIRRDGSTVEIDLIELFRGNPSQNLTLAGGDRVYVARAAQFYIYGQVQKPGVYKLERDMTVSRAISAGGGLTSLGSERRSQLKRRDVQGREQRIAVDGSELLQPDDVLLVRESLF